MATKIQKHFSEPTPGFFKRLQAATSGYMEDEDRQRALRVFEAFSLGAMYEHSPIETRPNMAAAAKASWPAWMDECLRRDLDHKSINFFVQYVLEFYEKSVQAEKASVGHAENHAMRDQIFEWLDTHKTPAMSLGDAATALAGKVVPLKWSTVREHCTSWNKLRSAGTPEG